MIRFGIVGCGGIAKKFARDIKFVKDAKLVAVSARTKEKAEKYKEQYMVPYAYSSYNDLASSNEINAVYIATPHSFHYEQAILFLKHKKHVLVEKPIAVNQLQFKEMIKVAKENNVLLMEAMWTYFLPSTIYIKKYIEDNNPGNLREANISFGYALIDNYPEERRLLNPNLAGGSLLDMGVYPVSFYNLISNTKIKNIDAKAELTSSGVDKTTYIKITDASNSITNIKSSIEEHFDNNATLIYDNVKIKIQDFSRSNKFYINNKEYNIPYEGEGFVHQIRSFVNTIEENKIENPIANHTLSMKTLEIMDQVRNKIGLTYPFEKNNTNL
ncbi:Gfo/Idh/MocA family protein [Candidatus Izemoplasma sp. B36]|uniref:Gfo/Idh/MocA family protein n=1 Tax=Candidatus Izemoplasma sp. B36 TaxID=3242468 RepID=UPI003556D7E9